MSNTPDWEAYDNDLTQGMARQLARAKHGVTLDSYEQLKEAFIFHTRYSCVVLKHQLWKLLRLRCVLCGKRHLRVLNRNGLYCSYGLIYTGKTLLSHWWYSGRHGED